MLIRGYEKRICCLLLILIFILSFSIFSFSADNSTISGDINITTNNGAANTTTGNIYIDNAELADSTLMDILYGKQNNISDQLYILIYHLSNSYNVSGNHPSVTSQNPFTGRNVTIPLSVTNYWYINNQYQWTYSQLSGTYLAHIYYLIYYTGQNIRNLGLKLMDYLNFQKSYTFYSFTTDGEYYTLSSSSQTAIWWDVMINRLDILIKFFDYFCGKFYNWYYPLDSSAPYYWRYYNTDTELQESIGLAGLWYNISWYLGEIYQNLTDAGSDMTQDAQSLGSSISALNTAEESVNTQIQSAFSTVSGIMTLPVISAAALCISWIEYMWDSLGIFQSPTLLAYMCVILMMLVGFAKYRSAFR